MCLQKKISPLPTVSLEELSATFINFKIVCNVFEIGRVQNLTYGKELMHLHDTV